ncbi:MAG: FumA C-terminus/TtdB family hydratase beta subunit [Candidatus Omnitrophota bacterium]
MKEIKTPLRQEDIRKLKAGDEVSLTGVIYTARDQAHKRLLEALKMRRKLPFDFKGQIIYYCGPTKTPRGKVIGSCGPTTSSRMDEFTPALIKAGLKGMVGKGRRAKKVREAIKKYRGVYFITIAGAGALLSKFVKRSDLIAYADLGQEAIYRLYVKEFPLIVAVDSSGKSVFKD